MCYNKELILNFNLTGLLVMVPILLLITRPLVPKLILYFSNEKKKKNKNKYQDQYQDQNNKTI